MGECSICERDARAGHDPSCPHYRATSCRQCFKVDSFDEDGYCKMPGCMGLEPGDAVKEEAD